MTSTSAPARSTGTGAVRRVQLALAGGLLVLALGASALLSVSAPRPAGSNRVRSAELLSTEKSKGLRLCQGHEVLYGGTSAIRIGGIWSVGHPGPAVRLTVTGRGRELTAGRTAAGWQGQLVTIPVRPVAHTAGNVTVCVSLGDGGRVELRGGYVGARSKRSATLRGGHVGRGAKRSASRRDGPLGGRVPLSYLRPGRESWWSYAGTVAHRMGLGRAWPGGWVAFAVGALMLTAIALAVARLVRDQAPDSPHEAPHRRRLAHLRARLPGPLRRLPAAAWVCALVACLNATAWSLITPPLQVPDEPDHFAYVQYFAETGRLPSTRPWGFSREELLAMALLRFGDPATRNHAGLWSSVEQRELERGLAATPSRPGRGPGGAALWEPPLYYALEAIPYRLASSGSVLDRIALMRLLSALMAGVTGLLVYLFLREALPRAPWAWTVGGLGLALQPVFGFVSGGVHADSLLYLSSAALFYCLARAFRRGLTPRLALASGGVIAFGMLSKLAFAALVPGALVALLVCALRQAPPSRRLHALRLAAAVAVAALIPLGLMMAINAVAFGRPPVGAASGASSYLSRATASHGSLLGFLDFNWQLYLPPLPFTTTRYFPGVFTAREIWLNGFLGLAGWSAVVHPKWVYELVPIPVSIALAFCARELIRMRATIRTRTAELAAYGLMLVSLAIVIGSPFYGQFLAGTNFVTQSRYLMPLACLFAAVLALVARGGGRRWGPAVGVGIVLTVVAADLGTQLLVISKWYG